MKKFTFTMTAIAVALLFTSQAFAWGQGPGRDRGYGHCREAGYERLNLTDDQKGKIDTLLDANYKSNRPLREKIFDQSVQLRRLWLQAAPDKDKIAAAQKELRELRNEMEDKITTLRLEIRNLLTPEQKEKLAGMDWGRGSGFGPRGGMRGQGEYGPGPGAGPGRGFCQ